MGKTTQDEKIREDILRGNLWLVFIRISLPLVVFSLLNHIFKIFDSVIAATVGSVEVSAVLYIHQIKFVFDSVSAGLSVGGAILIARYYGAHEDRKAAEASGNLMLAAILLSVVLILLSAFSRLILALTSTPPDLVPLGTPFLQVGFLTSAFTCFNMVFFGIERAKGQSRRIMQLNLMVMVIKLFLSWLTVYVLGMNVIMLSVSTLIAQSMLALVAVLLLLDRGNPLCLSFKTMRPVRGTLKSILSISMPIICERVAFSSGKVWMNSLSGQYGGLVVGALGVSNQVSGMVVIAANGFMDGNTTVMSQNLGYKSRSRVLGAFYRTFIINLIIGLAGMLIVTLCIDLLVMPFGAGDPAFLVKIKTILSYERYAFVSLTLTSAVFSLYYGLGLLRMVLIINFLRLFAFRIPLLLVLRDVYNVGYESVGIAMMVSNLLTGAAALTGLVIYRKQIWGREYKYYNGR